MKTLLTLTLSILLALTASAQKIVTINAKNAENELNKLPSGEYEIKITGEIDNDSYNNIINFNWNRKKDYSKNSITLDFSGCYGLDSVYHESYNDAYRHSVCSYVHTIVLPNGLKKIGSWAFSVSHEISKIVIPNTVTCIAPYAFETMYGLTEISFPSSVIEIGEGAFWNCKNLETVTIGSNVSAIKEDAFTYSGLQKIVLQEKTKFAEDKILYSKTDGMVKIPSNMINADGIIYLSKNPIIENGNKYYIWENNLLYKTVGGVRTELLRGKSIEKELKVPDGVKKIRVAIADKVYIPASVDTILNYYNFSEFEVSPDNKKYSSKNGCLLSKDGKALIYIGYDRKAVDVPEGVEKINEGSFEYSELNSVKLPSTLKIIERDAAINCKGTVEIPENVIDFGILNWSDKWSISKNNKYFTVENGIVYNKDKSVLVRALDADDSFVIPKTVKRIGRLAFAADTNLVSFTIPDNVEIIDTAAFNSCRNLRKIVIANSVRRINSFAFVHCPELDTVVLSENIEYIEKGVFYRKHKYGTIPTVVFPKSLKQIIGDEERDGGYVFDFESTDGWYFTFNIDDWRNKRNGIPISSLNYPQFVKNVHYSFKKTDLNINHVFQNGVVIKWAKNDEETESGTNTATDGTIDGYETIPANLNIYNTTYEGYDFNATIEVIYPYFYKM